MLHEMGFVNYNRGEIKNMETVLDVKEVQGILTDKEKLIINDRIFNNIKKIIYIEELPNKSEIALFKRLLLEHDGNTIYAMCLSYCIGKNTTLIKKQLK